jgi:hypothetical protein
MKQADLDEGLNLAGKCAGSIFLGGWSYDGAATAGEVSGRAT